jgi:hypothetical protein
MLIVAGIIFVKSGIAENKRCYVYFCIMFRKISKITYRVIQEELPPLTELISDHILSKKCHINLGPIRNIYRVTFVFGNALL